MSQKDLPVWRSLLFVPVTAQRFVNGAARRGADAIILDLEDAVAASEKERARTLVPEAAKIVSQGGADVVVRVNRPLRMTVRDLEAVIGPGGDAGAPPKAGSAPLASCRWDLSAPSRISAISTAFARRCAARAASALWARASSTRAKSRS